MIQARGDIADFCSLYQTEPSDLFDRSFESMLTGVRDLSRVYRENPDAKIEIPIEKKSLTMKQVMQRRDRRRCASAARTAASRRAC